MVPIIELGSDFYMHAEYGKTYVPIFKIVGWADEATLEVEEKPKSLLTRRGLPRAGRSSATTPLL